MKNFISTGTFMPFTCTADIASGAGLKIGNTFGVTVGAYSNGDLNCQLQVEGVFEMPKKTADTPAAGGKLYWDDTLKEMTTTVGTNKLAGTVWGDAPGAVSLVNVRLLQDGLL